MDVLTKISESPAALPRLQSGDIFYPDSDGEPMAETDTHANLLIYLRKALEVFFAEQEDVYVSGNIMFYYVEDDPTQVISPDVMVCFGVPKGDRTSYKTWAENDVAPSVVIELSSRGTWRKDRIEKKALYEMLGVKEYYIFNPLEPKTTPAFTVYELENGGYKTVKIENNRVKSAILGLELVVEGRTLRLYNPAAEQFLKTTEELAEENDFLRAEIERLNKLLQEND